MAVRGVFSVERFEESVNNSVYLLLVKRDLIIAFQKQS